jgi:hypothetical protein
VPATVYSVDTGESGVIAGARGERSAAGRSRPRTGLIEYDTNDTDLSTLNYHGTFTYKFGPGTMAR